MACRLPSASSSRWRNSSMSMPSTFTKYPRAKVRRRLVLDQRRCREHLLALDHLRLLIDVDDLELEAILEPRLAERAYRADGACRPRSHAGHEQAQHVMGIL